MANVASIIAKYQITNGGPVILWQPENEYTQFSGSPFNPAYMQYVEDQARNAGIVIPLMSNDASPSGHDTPGSGVGEVDIYVSLILDLPEPSERLTHMHRATTATHSASTARHRRAGLPVLCPPASGLRTRSRAPRHRMLFLR